MAAFSPIASAFSRMTAQAKPVRACVKVRVHSIVATEEAMPGGQAYMVWLNRNGKARGTQLVWATPGKATFDELVSVRCTLYRTKSGGYQSKEFDLQVLHNETNYEAPGQIFGRALLDLSCDLGRQQITLLDCADPDATIDVSISVDILEAPPSPVKTPSKEKKKSDRSTSSKGDAAKDAAETKSEGGASRPAGPIMITPKSKTVIDHTVDRTGELPVDVQKEDQEATDAAAASSPVPLASSPKRQPLQESSGTASQKNVAEAKDSPGMTLDSPTKPSAAASSVDRPNLPIKDAWA